MSEGDGGPRQQAKSTNGATVDQRIDQSVSKVRIDTDAVYLTASDTILPGRLVNIVAGPAVLEGRTDYLNELLELLNTAVPQEQVVVVSAVSGLGGIGKTSLAIWAAQEAAVTREWFSGGVLFIDLHGYDKTGSLTREQALERVVRALLGPEAAASGSFSATYEERLSRYQIELNRLADQGRPVLILADNASSEEQVSCLIPSRREHRLLITSRDRMPRLDARLIELKELELQSSVSMIEGALTRAYKDDQRVSQDRESASLIAQYCGFLPLALEIVLAILRDDPGLRLVDLAERLSDRRTRLAKIRHVDRHGTSVAIEAVLQVSFESLSDELQSAFGLLGLNPGPDISTEAATALLGHPARSDLVALYGASLISEQPVGSGRWRMHDLTRIYASDVAGQKPTGEVAAAWQRLVDYYAVSLNAAKSDRNAPPGTEQSGRFADRAEALDWLRAERANLAAIVPAIVKDAPKRAVEMAITFSWIYLSWQFFDDCVAVGTAGLAAVPLVKNPLALEAILRTNTGIALNRGGHPDESIIEGKRVVEIYRQLVQVDPEIYRGHLGRSLANLSGRCRRDEQALAFDSAQEAVLIGRDLYRPDDPTWPGVEFAGSLENLGSILESLHREDEAIELLEESIAIRRRQVAVDPFVFCPELIRQLINLAETWDRAGDTAQAIDLATEAVDVAEQQAVEDPDGYELLLAHGLMDLASYVVGAEGGKLGDQVALNHLQRAAELFRKRGDKDEIWARERLGHRLLGAGRLDEASEAYTRQRELSLAYRDLGGESWAEYHLGEVATEKNDLNEACAHFLAAADAFRRAEDVENILTAVAAGGRVLNILGQQEEAVALITGLLKSKPEIESDPAWPHASAELFAELGDARHAMGDRTSAAIAHEKAMQLFQVQGDEAGMQRMSAALKADRRRRIGWGRHSRR